MNIRVEICITLENGKIGTIKIKADKYVEAKVEAKAGKYGSDKDTFSYSIIMENNEYTCANKIMNLDIPLSLEDFFLENFNKALSTPENQQKISRVFDLLDKKYPGRGSDFSKELISWFHDLLVIISDKALFGKTLQLEEFKSALESSKIKHVSSQKNNNSKDEKKKTQNQSKEVIVLFRFKLSKDEAKEVSIKALEAGGVGYYNRVEQIHINFVILDNCEIPLEDFSAQLNNPSNKIKVRALEIFNQLLKEGSGFDDIFNFKLNKELEKLIKVLPLKKLDISEKLTNFPGTLLGKNNEKKPDDDASYQSQHSPRKEL